MLRIHLVHYEISNVWRIIWAMEDDNGLTSQGPIVGKVYRPQEEIGLESKYLSYPSFWRVEERATRTQGVRIDVMGYYWNSRTYAFLAYEELLGALAESKQDETPEWAKKALAAGWRPPTKP